MHFTKSLIVLVAATLLESPLVRGDTLAAPGGFAEVAGNPSVFASDLASTPAGALIPPHQGGVNVEKRKAKTSAKVTSAKASSTKPASTSVQATSTAVSSTSSSTTLKSSSVVVKTSSSSSTAASSTPSPSSTPVSSSTPTSSSLSTSSVSVSATSSQQSSTLTTTPPSQSTSTAPSSRASPSVSSTTLSSTTQGSSAPTSSSSTQSDSVTSQSGTAQSSTTALSAADSSFASTTVSSSVSSTKTVEDSSSSASVKASLITGRPASSAIPSTKAVPSLSSAQAVPTDACVLKRTGSTTSCEKPSDVCLALSKSSLLNAPGALCPEDADSCEDTQYNKRSPTRSYPVSLGPDAASNHALVARGSKETYPASVNGATIKIVAPTYPDISELGTKLGVSKQLAYKVSKDATQICKNVEIGTVSLTDAANANLNLPKGQFNYASEHIFERQAIRNWVQAAAGSSSGLQGWFASKYLAENNALDSTPIACSPKAGSDKKKVPSARVFENLGSKDSSNPPMVALANKLNSCKKDFWAGNSRDATVTRIKKQLKTCGGGYDPKKPSCDYAAMLLPLVEALSVFAYHAEDTVTTNLQIIVAGVAAELKVIEAADSGAKGLAATWPTFVASQLNTVKTAGNTFIANSIKTIRSAYDANSPNAVSDGKGGKVAKDPGTQAVLTLLNNMETQAKTALDVNTWAKGVADKAKV